MILPQNQLLHVRCQRGGEHPLGRYKFQLFDGSEETHKEWYNLLRYLGWLLKGDTERERMVHMFQCCCRQHLRQLYKYQANHYFSGFLQNVVTVLHWVTIACVQQSTPIIKFAAHQSSFYGSMRITHHVHGKLPHGIFLSRCHEFLLLCGLHVFVLLTCMASKRL